MHQIVDDGRKYRLEHLDIVGIGIAQHLEVRQVDPQLHFVEVRQQLGELLPDGDAITHVISDIEDQFAFLQREVRKIITHLAKQVAAKFLHRIGHFTAGNLLGCKIPFHPFYLSC